MKTIILFTSPGCKDSLNMKRLLREAEIDFNEQDISTSKELNRKERMSPVMLVQDSNGKARMISDIFAQLKLINSILTEGRN
ncbi:MAG: glutaredoxin domain-containing protein [Pseudomonadota bacterium]